MAALLAGAGVLVATAAAVSLLMALPAAALAETAGEPNAAGRARVWLAALLIPPVVGLAAALAALALHAQGTLASPHIGGFRPHLCLLPALHAPAGPFTMRAIAWLALLLVAAALVRAVAGAVSGHLLRRMMVESGGPLDAGDGPRVLAVELGRPVSFTAGLLRPAIVVSALLRARLGEQELAAIVAHERAHARRLDNLLGLLADAAVTLLIFAPSAWYFRRRLRAAMEEAADDAAIAAGIPAEALASALRSVERAANGSPHAPSLAALLVPEPALPAERRARLERLPSDTRTRVLDGRMRALLAAGVGLVLLAVLVLAARQPVEDSLFCWAEQLIAAAG